MTEGNEPLLKSKSQIKRELHDLQLLGKQLVGLPKKQLDQLPVSDDLKEAVYSAQKMKLTALKRQLKFITGLMQYEDESLIRSKLDELKMPHYNEVKKFHEVEQWRDDLIQGKTSLINELAIKFENFERQYVNQLIRNAKKEHSNNKPPKSARLLFKYLVELQENE